MTQTALSVLTKHAVITRGEQQALARLCVLAGQTAPSTDVLLALGLALRTQRSGDVCVDLASTAINDGAVQLPNTASWVRELASSPLVSTHKTSAICPFVLDDTKLYLRRAYEQEQALSAYVKHQAHRDLAVDETWLAGALTDLFGPPSPTTVNRQRLASAISMLRGLTVIAGGPGSGKTYTVVRILMLLNAWQAATNAKGLDVVLAAPTGRAAARLTASLIEAGVAAQKPAMTLHRLLGRRLTSTARTTDVNAAFLRADVVIVDEASMVGLPLFATLVGALKPSARLILLGDSNQLGAIDTGAVFHELCAAVGHDDLLGISRGAAQQFARVTGEPVVGQSANPQGIRDITVRLNVTHRFDDAGGVGRAAELMRDTLREPTQVVTDLRTLGHDQSGFTLIDPITPTVTVSSAKQALIHQAVNAYNAATNAVLIGHDARTALKLFDQFRLLCAIHDGPYGTRSFNHAILTELGRINPRFGGNDRFATGRFVLVTRNDASAGVQNGEVGVVVTDKDTGQVHVAFINGTGELHLVSPYRLQAPDDPYAMSVHKAQGSQFDHVALVLPDNPSAVVTRSLVYTAVTRAVSHATILDPAGGLTAALARVDVRVSGLSARLL